MDISIKVTYKSEGLQKLRKAAGLSQSQLADLAGIKVQVLQQYERGARDINGAKLPTLLKICNALECRLADIITDEGVTLTRSPSISLTVLYISLTSSNLPPRPRETTCGWRLVYWPPGIS